MANSVNPDQTQQQSGLGLHSLHMLLCQKLCVRNVRTFTLVKFESGVRDRRLTAYVWATGFGNILTSSGIDLD